MTPTPEQNAKRVLLLDKKATKGPWSVRKDYFDRDEPSQSAAYEVFPHTDGRAKPEDVGEWTALARCNSYEPDNKKNADLIATYRTAAPELARAYLKLETELQQLQEENAKLKKDRITLAKGFFASERIDWRLLFSPCRVDGPFVPTLPLL